MKDVAAAFLVVFAIALGFAVSFVGADVATERQKLIDALRGTPTVTVPEKPAEQKSQPKQFDCPKDSKIWKPTQLPMVFDDGYFYYGRLTLADYVAFVGFGCHMCHSQKKMKEDWCRDQIYRDGKWSWPQGELHIKHRREGCAACHRLEK